MDDMYDINPQDASRELVPPFDKYWKISVEKGRKQQMANSRKAGKSDIQFKPHSPSNGSVLYAMVRAYGGPFWFAGMLQLAISGLQFASPYLMRELMAVIALDEPLWKGFLLTFGLFGASLLLGLFNGQYLYYTFLAGFRIRTGLISAIYRKALRISSAAKKDTTVGEIVNLMAVDAQKFFELTSYLHILWSALLIIGLCVFLLYDILGPAVFAGLGVMILMTPVSGVVAAKLKSHQVAQMKLKDERVKKMNEILGGIKVLKLYAWEPSFQDSILTVRNEEVGILKRMAYYGAGIFFTFTIAPFLVTLVSFAVYVLIDENNVLDPQTAFVSLALFNIMRFPLEIYLFDDPLSAVDAHVGKHIFEKVIGPSGMLVGKSRLLVTHGISFLPFVENILVLKEGEISESGTYQQLIDQKGAFAEFLSQHIQELDDRDEEESATGAVTWLVYKKYIKSIGFQFGFGSVLFSAINQGSGIFSNLWLTDWSEDPAASTDTSVRDKYLGVYGALGGAQSIALFLAALLISLGCLKAAKESHNKLLESSLRMPMSFFDTTPLGRIINRFSKDVDVVDNVLPVTIRAWLLFLFSVIGVFIVIGLSTPIFLAIVPPLMVIYYFVQRFYIDTSRQLKRLESVTRSPIYSHFGESIGGQSTIRAYGQQDRFTQESERRVDYNQLVSYPTIVANRWLSVRLELIGSLVILFAAFFAILARDTIGQATVGISISYALQISHHLSFLVRMTAEVETNIVAVERLDEYTVLPREAEWQKGTVDKAWPAEGKVEFKDYQIRYREGLDLVIRGISLNVRGGEKIGIVGRTGAGKSTMTFEDFCGGPFWDDEFVWDIDNPNLTFCFQRVILQWVPCLFLFVFSIYDILKITESRYRDIPWNWYNLSKMLVIFLLMCMSWIDLGMVVSYQDEQGLYDVQILTAVFNALAYIDLIVLLFFMRKYGVRTSGTMFMFWFLRMFFGIIQLRTEVMENDKRPNAIGSGDTVDFWEYQYVSYIIQYSFICLMLVLELFPDKAPKVSHYPESKNPNPELQSSFFSKLLFLYFDAFAWKGFRKPLTMEELYDINPQDTSRELVPPFDKYWEMSVASGRKKQIVADKKAGKTNVEYKPHSETNGSSLYAMVRAYGAPFWFAGMLQLAISGLQFASPYLMQEMMAVIALDGPVWKGLLLTFALFLASLLLALLNGQYFYNTFLSGFRIRTGLVSAIYRKALRISSAAKKDTTVGEIVNLMAVDAQRFFELTSYLHILWSGILIIALCVYLLYDILGAAVFAGLGVMILITPVSGVIATKMRDAQVAQMKIKDDRVKKMNEILGGIKVLKLYAWEPSFQDNILTVRREEIGILKRMAYYGAGIYFTFTIAPFLVTLVSFAVYVLMDEENILDPQTAFVSLALFNILRFPLGMLPMMVTFSMQAWVSVKRIDKFLNSAELDPSNVTNNKSDEALTIKDGTFSWGDETPTLKNINLSLRKGQLSAIVGTVGTGKSSLISALLGEMEKISGHVNTDGSIAYVPQQAWIQNATLRDNILFGKPFDQKKYDNVIECCALKPDLEMLPGGDTTEIGEKGINLSGGQKQRVALARAVYADAEIYLFDDPLSAVDAHVGKHIFEKVIGPSGMLVGKSRLLVTHGISYLPFVENIFVVKEGEISESGSYQQLLDQKGAFAEFLTQHIQELDESDEEELLQTFNLTISSPEIKLIQESLKDETAQRIVERTLSVRSGRSGGSNGSQRKKRISRQESKASAKKEDPIIQNLDKATLIEKEESATGSVTWAVYKKYVTAIGFQFGFWSVVFSIINQGSGIYSSMWLTDWSEDPEAITDTSVRDMYLGVYGALGGVQSIALFIGSVLLALGCLKAAEESHDKLLESSMHMPMSFFDTTPLGRIINRFSKDVDVVDNILPATIRAWLLMLFSVIGVFVVIGISTPIFLAIVPPLMVIYYFVQRFYIETSRQLKRLESVTRSPIYSHFGESIGGQSTIRAYAQQERFIKESEYRLDYNQLVTYPTILANRWLGVRLEIIGSLVILFAALFAILARDTIGQATVGLSISYALQISNVLSFLVRMTAEVETNIVAIERLEEYTN
uniref:ABC-type glutathione-S-conjugate transporter n=1 Tax=Anopheles culicifacies TaxID=139723 RepID=A0A182M895_9DIPT